MHKESKVASRAAPIFGCLVYSSNTTVIHVARNIGVGDVIHLVSSFQWAIGLIHRELFLPVKVSMVFRTHSALHGAGIPTIRTSIMWALHPVDGFGYHLEGDGSEAS